MDPHEGNEIMRVTKGLDSHPHESRMWMSFYYSAHGHRQEKQVAHSVQVESALVATWPSCGTLTEGE